MKSTQYSNLCLKLFGRFFKKIKREELEEKNLLLEKSNISMEYEEYYSFIIMNILIGLISTLIATTIIYFIIPNIYTMSLIFILTSIVTITIGIFFWYLPYYFIKLRINSINKFLPYAINFISSMAVAGVSPSEIFQTLSTINVYGEIQTEAKRITKEIKIMGIDNITALKHSIELTPSRKFKTFLQGMIGTIQSGSDLQEYLCNVTQKYLEEDIVERKKTLEMLSVVAEAFVISVIAFPIFLVIILSIMGFFGGSMETSIMVLYLFSLLILPAVYVGFYYIITSTTTKEISKLEMDRNYDLYHIYKTNKKSIWILIFSAIAYLIFLIAIYILTTSNVLINDIYLTADLVFIGVLFFIGPVSFYLHSINKIKREIQNRLPDFLTEIGDSLSAGMNAFEAIKVAEKGRYGKLEPEIKKMKSQLSWNISIRNVFNNFANRMKTGIIKRIVVTINEGLIMGGNNSRIFKAAATEINQVNNIENERRANMSVYMAVILLCFFVFLAIILIIDKTIFTTFFDLQSSQASKAGDIISINTIDQLQLKYAIFSFVFAQSIGAGVLAGYLIDSKISSGIRYGVALAIISFIVFKTLF